MNMNDIAKVAAQFSIPPALLQAVIQQQGITGGSSVPDQVLAAYGLHANDIKDDPDKQLEIAARTLSQQFSMYGSWEKALSSYMSGDPNAYTSPTSSVGGFVYSVMGAAAADPAAGMEGYTPANASLFATGASDFGNHLQELNSMGGVISPQHTQAWLHASSHAFSRARQASVAGGTTEVGQGHNARGPGAGAFSGPGEDFPWGQCTWFAAGAASSWLTNTKGFGDAHNWLGAAQNNGYPTGGAPKVGAVVVYAAGGGYDPEAGHVGVVTGVNQDGTFQVTSDHWGGLGQTHIGTSTMSDVSGFIYPPDDKTGAQTAEIALKTSGQDPQSFAAQWNALQSTGSDKQQQTLAQQQAKTLGTIPKNAPPKPGEVGDFAGQLQGAGIDPDHFAQHFPQVSSLYRKYMQRSPTIADYAPMAQMSAQEMIQHVLNQPHPTYLEHTVGTIAKWFDTAMLHSVPFARRTPHLAEAAKFASSQPKWSELADYYQKLGQPKQPTQQQGGQPQQQQPQPMSDVRQRVLDRETR